MTSTITANDGTGNTTVPAAVEGFQADDEGRTIVHQIIGGGVAVAIIPPDPANGTLQLVYTTEAAADAARDLHRRKTTFTLVNTDVATVGMTYAVTGISRILTPDIGKWEVRVRFQEVV